MAVVGAGAAGLWVALQAAERGASVVLLSRTPLSQSASFWAQGGLAAALEPGDSAEQHAADTLAAGRGLCRTAAVQVLSEGAPVTPGPLPPGSIRVVISRTTAFVPDCPRSDHYRGPSSTSPNYGCAVNSNWAAMVANPSDLVLGQVGAVGANGEAGTKAIRVYRQAAPTGTKGLNETNTRGGN